MLKKYLQKQPPKVFHKKECINVQMAAHQVYLQQRTFSRQVIARQPRGFTKFSM